MSVLPRPQLGVPPANTPPVVDMLVVHSGSADVPGGALPILLLEFRSSLDGRVFTLQYLGDDEGLRALVRCVGEGVEKAVEAAEARRAEIEAAAVDPGPVAGGACAGCGVRLFGDRVEHGWCVSCEPKAAT